MNILKQSLITVISFVFALSLSACGGSSGTNDDTEATVTLSGTVATGAAFAGTLNIMGSGGAQALGVAIAADGTYRANISGLSAPFILQATPTDPTQAMLYSYAAAANTIANVTQLTTLAVFIANGNADLGPYYTAWASRAAAFTQQAMQDAQAAINANLAKQLQASGLDYRSYDFLSTAFTANSAGIDAVLDNTTLMLSGGNFFVSVVGNTNFSFDSNIDTSAINIGGNNATTYSISGTISGATSKFVLQNSKGDSMSVAGTRFTLPTALADGASYSVNVSTQPLNETCTVTNGSGTINGANITDIMVTCLAKGGGATYTVSGTVNGNTSAISLELQKNNQTINDLPSFTGGNFSFPNTFDSGENYAVIITSQPTGQNCTLSNDSGAIASADITNVTITCTTTPDGLVVSGTVTGLAGTVVLELRKGGVFAETLYVDTADFAFSALKPKWGWVYEVLISEHPAGQVCVITANNAGVITDAIDTNVTISCTARTALSVASATLSVQPRESFDFSTGAVPAAGIAGDIGGIANEGVNFDIRTYNSRRALRLATSGSLDALPSIPVWSDAAPWVMTSWDFTDGTGGLPLAVGEIWVIYTGERNYAVLQVTGLPGGGFGSSFTFDYLYQPDGTRNF